jgi:hypothetical protein
MGDYATAGAGGALDGSAGSNEGELVRADIAGEESWYGPLAPLKPQSTSIELELFSEEGLRVI